MSFQVLPGRAAPHGSAPFGTFTSGRSLEIERVAGPILEHLDCLPSDLTGHGWRPFLHPDDRDVLFRLAHELQAGRSGHYDLRASSRRADCVLHLRIRTLLLESHGAVTGMTGVIDLRHRESRRTIGT